MSWSFNTIAVIESPCKEKFGVPRQSGLVPELTANIVLLPPYDREEAIEQLDTFSHIWVLSVFHEAMTEDWRPTVRPPRLGGNKRVGVFASRSPFRPNPIALSVFKLEGVERCDDQLQLLVSGCDLVHGTPVLDIKPYLPYADCIADARAGYVETIDRNLLPVIFESDAAQACAEIESNGHPGFCVLIERLIAQDPRPAYHDESRQQIYGLRIYDYNVRFRVERGQAVVTAIDF